MPVARTTTAPDLPSIHPGERVLLAQSDPAQHRGAGGGQRERLTLRPGVREGPARRGLSTRRGLANFGLPIPPSRS